MHMQRHRAHVVSAQHVQHGTGPCECHLSAEVAEGAGGSAP